jgi:hypothetical protein
VTAPSARRRPPGRYDEPSLLGQRVLAVLLAVLLLVVVAAVVAYVLDRVTGEQVRGQLRAFEVRSDREVALDVEAAKTAGARAYCVVRAVGRDGLEVGRDVVVLDAVGTPDEVARSSFVLATTARAVSVELAGCTPEVISRDDPAP